MIKQILASSFCLECKGCCRFRDRESMWTPSLLVEEAKKLTDLGINASDFSCSRKKILPHEEDENGMFLCPFLNPQTNACQIYSYRPLECQLYPFLLTRRGEKAFLSLDLHCPYMEEHGKDQKIQEYARSLQNFLQSHQQRCLLENNLHIIQPYEDVLDLLELFPLKGKL